MNETYRSDIDGLRAIAVVSVILFHLGYLPNGYLGVDVFFVISGYLISGNIFQEISQQEFSLLHFYERRIRRIFPLVLFTSAVAFLLGLLFMLPDDLENLCESVLATNFSANNFLMYSTSKNYWAVANAYNPLMHTWSLGIEEQFYLVYPLLFYFVSQKRKHILLPLLVFLSIASMALLIWSTNTSAKFYFLPYRFFELAIGGISAIYVKNKLPTKLNKYRSILSYSMLACFFYLLALADIKSNELKLVTMVGISSLILAFGKDKQEKFYHYLLSNKIVVFIGKISFSLYLWHQIIFAFVRYFLLPEITPIYAWILSLLILLVSIFTYYLIEQPFRNRQLVQTKPLVWIVLSLFLILSIASFYIYLKDGVIKDFPELGIEAHDTNQKSFLFREKKNFNIYYNTEVRNFDQPFSQTQKIKLLVIGDSYGRDFFNVLKESGFSDSIELRYAEMVNGKTTQDISSRLVQADYIFIALRPAFLKTDFQVFNSTHVYDTSKVWVVGTKDFGHSNGIYYYQKKKLGSSLNGFASMKKGAGGLNQKLKKEWGDKFLDQLTPLLNATGQVQLFTPEGKFISQDTLHLTKDGAKYLAQLLESKLREILKMKEGK